MIRKEDYLKTIIAFIRSKSGIEYQQSVRSVLSTYYQSINKTYQMPDSAGGDYKNDGWCKEDSTFYQIYSPKQFSKSFVKDVLSKFEVDFVGLSKHVFTENRWGGKINKFVFLVNTRGDGVPVDPDDKAGEVKVKIEEKYNIKIAEVLICDDEYIIDILNEMSNYHLRNLIIKMGLSGYLTVVSITPADVCHFFALIGELSFNETNSKSDSHDFKRMSTDEKIRINELVAHYDHIQELLSRLSIVDMALKISNKSVKSYREFEQLKDLFIANYCALKKLYSGDVLYDKLLDSIVSLSDSFSQNPLCAELVMVFIFDRCDIFEKETNSL